MISVREVSVSFGSFELLDNISFLINPQDRIGLAGKNGAGKSTLLKIIAGLQTPTSGQVDMPKDFTIGYLPQQMKVNDTTTVINEAITAFSEIIGLSDDIEKTGREIAGRNDYESAEYLKLCDHLTVIEERYRMLGGTNYIAEAEQTLIGLGFERKNFDKLTKELSGGWRMRVELAKILLKKPFLFLLDEPTNHLDIESIQWLESFLSGYPGAVVLVSHDRAFLDNVTRRTIEISIGKIYDYKASYSKFIELRKERREQQIAAYRNQQKMIGDTEKFIERFRYKATKAVQVQSKIKQLDKVERLEVDEEDNSKINIRFAPAPRSGTVVIKAENLSKSFGTLEVLKNIDITIERGEKIAFVGRNGEGKTTLSRIIVGELIYDGLLKKGHNVNTGYFAQNQDELLDENKTVLQTIDEVAKGDIRTKIRDMLGAFLFKGEDIDKKVKVLSGGERSRLALVKLLLEPYNLLVLDEPTNHLDIRSKGILKQALIKYDGTLIVVSHDRDFLDGLIKKVYEFRDNRIKENIGGIYDFLRKKKIENLKDIEIREKTGKTAGPSVISENKRKYIEKKEYDRNLRKLLKRIEETEAEIEKIEADISDNNKNLMNHDHSSGDDVTYFLEYQNLKEILQGKMNLWGKQTQELEEFIKNNN
jgi:ATP-binding cassette subfamily F protein 3